MESGFTITVVDPDDDYLGVEVAASNGRFTGSSRIYAAPDDLSRMAHVFSGFPSSVADARHFELGSRNERQAGGYVGLFLHTVGNLGHAVLEVEFLDDDQRYSAGEAKFAISVEAAGIDRFVRGLLAAESAQAGAARLAASS